MRELPADAWDHVASLVGHRRLWSVMAVSRRASQGCRGSAAWIDYLPVSRSVGASSAMDAWFLDPHQSADTSVRMLGVSVEPCVDRREALQYVPESAHAAACGAVKFMQTQLRALDDVVDQSRAVVLRALSGSALSARLAWMSLVGRAARGTRLAQAPGSLVHLACTTRALEVARNRPRGRRRRSASRDDLDRAVASLLMRQVNLAAHKDLILIKDM
jgi:hypothetical protein